MKHVFFVECNPDRLLLQKIGVTKRSIIHAGSKSGVCKRLSKTTYSVGVVDEDPYSVQPRYLKGLKIIENSQKHDVKVLFDEKRNNRVIVISPRLEEWIIRAAKEAKVNMHKYGLPGDGNKLHKLINSELSRFERLLGELINKSGRISFLRRCLLERGEGL